MAIVFDKLAFVRKLEGASIPRNQAEAMSEAFHDAVSETVATKADIATLEADIAAFRAEVKAEMSALRAELKGDVSALGAEVNADTSAFRAEVKADASAFRAEVKANVSSLRAEFKSDLRDVGSSLKLWVISVGVGALVTTLGAMTAILRFLLKSPV